MSRFILINLLSVLLTFPAVSSAKRSISILGFEASPGLNKKAAFITKTLRKIASSDSSFKLLPNHEIEEAKLMYCEDENNQKCLGKISKGLGGNYMISGKVSKSGNMLKLSLILIDNGKKSGKNMKYSTFTFPRNISNSALRKKLKNVWSHYFSSNSSQLKLNAPASGLKVFIDGQFAMNTVKGQNLIPRISAGSHHIKVQNPSGKVWEQTVIVNSGKIAVVNISFDKPQKVITVIKTDDTSKKDDNSSNNALAGVKTEENKEETSSEPINKWKMAFWITASTSAVMIVSGVYTGIKVKQYEDDKDSVMAKDPASYAGVSDVCKSPTPEMKSICDNGQSMAMWTNILFASGVTLGVVSSYLMYKGYMEEAEVSGKIEDSSNSSVFVMPVIFGNGGGISIRAKF